MLERLEKAELTEKQLKNELEELGSKYENECNKYESMRVKCKDLLIYTNFTFINKLFKFRP